MTETPAQTPVETETETEEAVEQTVVTSEEEDRPTGGTARVHAWFVDEDGIENHVTRRDDGRWYVNNTNPQDKAEFMSMDAAADLVMLAKTQGRMWGWLRGLPDGERFDEAVAPTLDGTDPEEDGE